MTRLCIVSREFSMLYGYLMILLERELSGPEPLEMIVDRRQGHPSDTVDPPPPRGIERRARRGTDEALRQQGYVIVGPVADAPSSRARWLAERAAPALREVADRGARIRPLVSRVAVAALLLLAAGIIGLTVAVATPSNSVERISRLVAGLAASWSRDTAVAPVSSPSASIHTAPAVLPTPPAAALAPAPAASDPAPPRPPAAEPPKTEQAPMPPAAPEQPSRVVASSSTSGAGKPASLPPAAPARAAGERSTTATSGTERAPASTPAAAERPRTGPRFSGMPRVELATEPEGSGSERSISYTARLADPAGRPLSDADVSLHGAMPDGRSVQAQLEPTSTPGAYAGKLTVGRQTPGLLRLRVLLGGSLLDIPVDR